MQVLEAIQSIADAGEVRLDGENIRILIRPEQQFALEPALRCLRERKREAVEILKSRKLSSSPVTHLPGGGELGNLRVDAAMDHLNRIGARIMPGPVLAVPRAAGTGETKDAIAALGMEAIPLVLLP